MQMDYLMKSKFTMEILSLDHANDLYELTDSNREYLREWLPWLDDITSSKDTEKFIESTIKISSEGGAPNFAIMYGTEICGVAGFHEINSHNRAGSIGYWLSEEHTGKGIITKATKQLLSMGFSDFNLNKIEIRCAEGNNKSSAIPERLGFTYEATLRQCEWLYSKYVNHAVYSILSSEFRA